MQISKTEIPDLLIMNPRLHKDGRGFFCETWRNEWGALFNLPNPFVQDNHARSEAKWVMRGLHFQKPPYAQSKLICAVRGAIYDVAVDIRKGSPTFGKAFGIILSEENFLRLFVPRGFAHGYMTLTPGTEVQYKVDAYYKPEQEDGIHFADPALAIDWPCSEPVLSEKDKRNIRLCDLVSPFDYEKTP